MWEIEHIARTGEEGTGRVFKTADRIGRMFVEGFHLLGLFAIGFATVWAGAAAFWHMMQAGAASVEDLLLLFIYLEIGAMVGIYFKTNHMPVRFLVYVAITAMTRHLIGYVNTVKAPDMGLLIMAGSVLLLALSVLIIRFASSRFPMHRPAGSAAGKQASQQTELDD